MLVDFSPPAGRAGKAEEKINKFSGSENKTTILYNCEIYMLKYPDPVRQGKFRENLSYKNNQFSEHIGSQIFKTCGFNTQETFLGTFADRNGTLKIVVACKDFTQNGSTLYEFSKLANQSLLDKLDKNISIEDVYTIIEKNLAIKDKQAIIKAFWDMFVIDALIGNRDRHFGNFGLLEHNGAFDFAPIYDCGSSLSALLDDEHMEYELLDSTRFKQNAFNITSCYRMNDRRIFYHEIFKNLPHDLQNAIKRTVPKIDLGPPADPPAGRAGRAGKIGNIIDETPKISDIRKEYLKSAVLLRYEQILLPSFRRLEKEKAKSNAILPKSKKRYSHDR